MRDSTPEGRVSDFITWSHTMAHTPHGKYTRRIPIGYSCGKSTALIPTRADS